MDEYLHTFLNPKPVEALINVHRSRTTLYCTQVAKSIDTTYAHTVKIISKLEDKGLIECEKKGRKKYLEITSKGEEYAKLFIDLIELEKGNQSKTVEGLDTDLTQGSPIKD